MVITISYLTTESIDILIKLTYFKSIEALKNVQKMSSYRISKLKKDALNCIALATGLDLINLDADYVLDTMRQRALMTYESYCKTLEEFMVQGIDDIETKVIWEQIPCDDKYPTAIELMDFIIDTYKDDLSATIKKMSFYGILIPKGLMLECTKTMYDIEWNSYYKYFQLRFYDFQDKLVQKIDCKDEKQAEKIMQEYNSNENERDISRCVFRRSSIIGNKNGESEWQVRKIVRNRWYIPYFMEVPRRWQVQYYDYQDYLIKSELNMGGVTREEVLEECVNINALYAVVLFEERVKKLEWTVDDCILNTGCECPSLANVLNKIITNNLNNQQYFKSLLERDQEETQTVL